MAQAIFIGGTGSNVGKSWMATAMCRLLARRGRKVAPFKAQNMSNNSFPCRVGGEIGRSQVAQAEACGIEPVVHMNPVLLKPLGESRSQVVVHGEAWKTVHARDYYQYAPTLRDEAVRAYRDLAKDYEIIVIEGAGSVAEINLWGRDFTNLSMARAANARALLVADIERGGVFASILGTLDLLPPEDRAVIRSFAVNRFRGDRSLFNDGVKILEERSGLPCLGVFPFERDIELDAEDSLCLTAGGAQSSQEAKIAIVRLPHVSNTTDFRLLPHAVWMERPSTGKFDVVILPGTKATIPDLLWLRESGLDTWLLQQYKDGATVLGICGGYQMLGEMVVDRSGADGTRGSLRGLGLLPIHTEMQTEKITRTRQARTPAGSPFGAYEIHMGRTTCSGVVTPFAFLENEEPEGIISDRVMGTYLHGALESADLIEELLGFRPESSMKNAQYDAMADWLEKYASQQVLDELTSA